MPLPIWRESSCTTVPSTTSTMSGSPASPSSSAPLGDPPHHPSHCTAPRPAWATKLRGRLSRLSLKKAPWPQGAWPLGGTHSVRRQHSKRRAAKRSLVLRKSPVCSPHRLGTSTHLLRCIKTPCCTSPQRTETRKIKLSVTKGLLRPLQAVVPSPPSCAAWPGRASSSQTCPHATMAQLTLLSSSSSTSWASKPPTGMRRSWRTGSPWLSRTAPAPGS